MPRNGSATVGTEAALATALMALLACPDVVPASREGARQYARHKPEETLHPGLRLFAGVLRGLPPQSGGGLFVQEAWSVPELRCSQDGQ